MNNDEQNTHNITNTDEADQNVSEHKIIEQIEITHTTTEKTGPVNGTSFGIPQAIVTAAVVIGLALIFIFAPTKTNTKPTNGKMYNAIELFATNMGIDATKFEACMDAGTTAQTVVDQATLAKPLNIEGTPTSIIIIASTNQQIQIVGALPLATISAAIDMGLAGKIVPLADEQKPKSPTVLLPGDHILGNANAPIVIVEYSDSDCPYCQKFHEIMRQVKNNYGDKVAWVYRHYPLDGLHPKARMEAEASECVAKLSNNETFWKYLDAMFTINSSAS